MKKKEKRYTEERYETVLDRVYIRAKVKGKWDNLSLRDGLGHQDELKKWLMRYLLLHVLGIKTDQTITEKELIDVVKWMDGVGIDPVRLRHDYKEAVD